MISQPNKIESSPKNLNKFKGKKIENTINFNIVDQGDEQSTKPNRLFPLSIEFNAKNNKKKNALQDITNTQTTQNFKQAQQEGISSSQIQKEKEFQEQNEFQSFSQNKSDGAQNQSGQDLNKGVPVVSKQKIEDIIKENIKKYQMTKQEQDQMKQSEIQHLKEQKEKQRQEQEEIRKRNKEKTEKWKKFNIEKKQQEKVMKIKQKEQQIGFKNSRSKTPSHKNAPSTFSISNIPKQTQEKSKDEKNQVESNQVEEKEKQHQFQEYKQVTLDRIKKALNDKKKQIVEKQLENEQKQLKILQLSQIAKSQRLKSLKSSTQQTDKENNVLNSQNSEKKLLAQQSQLIQSSITQNQPKFSKRINLDQDIEQNVSIEQQSDDEEPKKQPQQLKQEHNNPSFKKNKSREMKNQSQVDSEHLHQIKKQAKKKCVIPHEKKSKKLKKSNKFFLEDNLGLDAEDLQDETGSQVKGGEEFEADVKKIEFLERQLQKIQQLKKKNKFEDLEQMDVKQLNRTAKSINCQKKINKLLPIYNSIKSSLINDYNVKFKDDDATFSKGRFVIETQNKAALLKESSLNPKQPQSNQYSTIQEPTGQNRGRSQAERQEVKSILKRNQSACIEKQKRSKTVTFDEKQSNSEPENQRSEQKTKKQLQKKDENEELDDFIQQEQTSKDNQYDNTNQCQLSKEMKKQDPDKEEEEEEAEAEQENQQDEDNEQEKYESEEEKEVQEQQNQNQVEEEQETGELKDEEINQKNEEQKEGLNLENRLSEKDKWGLYNEKNRVLQQYQNDSESDREILEKQCDYNDEVLNFSQDDIFKLSYQDLANMKELKI